VRIEFSDTTGWQASPWPPGRRSRRSDPPAERGLRDVPRPAAELRSELPVVAGLVLRLHRGP